MYITICFKRFSIIHLLETQYFLCVLIGNQLLSDFLNINIMIKLVFFTRAHKLTEKYVIFLLKIVYVGTYM